MKGDGAVPVGYVQLLGVPRVRVGESWHPLVPDQRHQLLAYLAFYGDWVNRDRAAFLFWPDIGTQRAKQNLRTLLYRVRALEWPGLEADAYRVRWSVATDVAAFRQAVTAARLDEALSLYAGGLLKDMEQGEAPEFSAWLALERGHLHASWREAVLRRAEGLTEAGRDAEAAELLSRLLAEDELDEEALQSYITSLARAGQQREALRSYKVFSKRLQDELGMEPTSTTRQLVEATRNSAALTPTPPSAVTDAALLGKPALEKPAKGEPGWLPTPATSFIGRDLELAEVGALLSKPDCRLLTLSGPGGIGKTRVALQAAQELRSAYRDGAYFASLDALSSPESIPSTLATTLELPLQGSEPPLAQVSRHLKEKHVLLVLDNYEHLLDGATLTSELLQSCPELKVLVTSRERLNLEEEWVLPLEGLSYPEGNASLENASDYEAVRLFVARAQRVSPGFALTETELPHVLKVCRLVQGLPLGLELAAAWVRAMPPEEIAGELETNLDLLSTGSRNVNERHRSVRAAIEHSWRLLSAAEQEVLRKLSVFRGGFRKEAAVYVADASIAVLAALVDKSLLRLTPSGRYDRHLLVYQYTQEKLHESPEEQARSREKHGLYYHRLLQVWGAELDGPQVKLALDTFDEEMENIEAAWSWAVEGIRLKELQLGAECIVGFYQTKGYSRKGIELLYRAEVNLDGLDLTQRASLGYLLLAQARLYYRIQHMEKSKELAHRAIHLLRPLGEREGVARALLYLGAAHNVGDSSKAKQYLEQALTLAKEAHSDILIGAVLFNLASAENSLGNYANAERYAREALDIFRKLQNHRLTSATLSELGLILLSTRDSTAALDVLQEALKLAKESGNRLWEAYITDHLARAYIELKDYSSTIALTKQWVQHAEELSAFDLKSILLVCQARGYTGLRDFDAAAWCLKKSLKLLPTFDDKNMHISMALLTLLGLTEMRIKQEKFGVAARCLGFVLCHSELLEFLDRRLAEDCLRELQQQLPSATLTALLERGRQMTLAEVSEMGVIDRPDVPPLDL